MRPVPGLLATLALSWCAGCGGPSLVQHQATAGPAVQSLRDGRFDAARDQAAEALRGQDGNPYARLVRAIAAYRKTMHQLWADGRTMVVGAVAAGGLNDRYARSALEQAEADLALVDEDLAAVYRHEDVALELCLACWEVDWNGNGRVDDRDRRLFEIELDAQGEELPEGDPRRRPTFRFDHGDIAWARAFVTFQRAALDVLLAYDFSDLNRAVASLDNGGDEPIVIRLAHRERIDAARKLVLRGLELSDESRRDYLAESDDDREWVPNPRQRSHPLPLPVDAELYRTWELVVGDLARLVQGKEGLSVAELAQLGDHQWKNPPRGYVDVGRMLSAPKDIVLHPSTLERLDRGHDVEGMLVEVLGEYYVREMKASPLPGRLSRMKTEVDRGEESFERKLRYLIWIN